jgi:GDP-mannose pyrophosphatase NudK
MGKMNNIKILKRKILSDHIYLLKETEFEYQRQDGTNQIQKRISFDRGNGAACLLFNKKRETFLLTRQFRFPIFELNSEGNSVELCAGLLDEDSAEQCMIREIEEETGYNVPSVKKIMEIFPSPGAVTEKLYLFAAEYKDSMKISDGGGLKDEGEEIEVFELSIKEALRWINNGKIMDAKTIIMLQWAALNNIFKT